MELPTPLSAPEVEFRKHYREDWGNFLETPAGKLLFQVLFTYMPKVFPQKLPHNECHQNGEVQEWQIIFDLLFSKLRLPIQDAQNEVPQNYPREEEVTLNPTELE